MTELEISARSGPYKITVLRGLIAGGGAALRQKLGEIYNNGRIAVITDENVYRLYGESLKTALGRGFEANFIVIPPGETSKSLKTLELVYSKLAEMNLKREELIAAFGGGVAGDLAGFAAATFLRGVNYIQIPTTLLAAVDSSVGGKTAINLAEGKNLAGAFYSPAAVYFDPELLATLPPREFSSGMAEVVKYALLSGGSLLEILRTNDRESIGSVLEELVYECCKIKKSYVEADEFDRGKRALLNLGHTFGHAIEKITRYEKYTHGEAVAIGLSMMAEYCLKNGLCGGETAALVGDLLERYALPAESGIPAAEILLNMKNDKKNRAGKRSLIVLRRPGAAEEIFIKE